MSEPSSEVQVDQIGHESMDPTLTVASVMSALNELSSLWSDIGAALKIPSEILSKIAEDFDNNNDRLYEVIFYWRTNNRHCTWETIEDILSQLNKDQYIERIKIRQYEHGRIPIRDQPFIRQLESRNDTCYDDYWLQQRVEFEPDMFNYKVRQEDVPDIEIVLWENCPLKWYEIGLHLRIPKSALDVIDKDQQDTRRKLTEMLWTWINTSERGTWRELVDVLKKLKENSAAEALAVSYKKICRGYPGVAASLAAGVTGSGGTTFDSSEFKRPSYSSLQFDHQHQKDDSKKKRLMQELRTLLKVNDDVSDNDVINNMAKYIKKGKLNQDELEEVVRKVDALQGCMTESSSTLRSWASALRKDLNTATTIIGKLHSKQQDLKVIQERLERNKRLIELLFFLRNFSVVQWFISGNLQEEKLKTEKKLKNVTEDLRKLEMDLEWANADYRAIVEKLTTCRTELEACVEEWQRFKAAVQASGHLIYILLGAGVGATAAGVVGGIVGAALGPVGVVVGVTAGASIGAYVGGRHGAKASRDQIEEFNRLTSSCVTETNEVKRELRAIQQLLDEARRRFSTP